MFFSQIFICLFVFERRPLISFRCLRWTNGLQLRMRADTQTVLRDCNAFFSSHPTTLCCAMLPNWQPLRRYDLPECKGKDALEMLTKIDCSTFFRHPIPGVVSTLPLVAISSTLHIAIKRDQTQLKKRVRPSGILQVRTHNHLLPC